MVRFWLLNIVLLQNACVSVGDVRQQSFAPLKHGKKESIHFSSFLSRKESTPVADLIFCECAYLPPDIYRWSINDHMDPFWNKCSPTRGSLFLEMLRLQSVLKKRLLFSPVTPPNHLSCSLHPWHLSYDLFHVQEFTWLPGQCSSTKTYKIRLWGWLTCKDTWKPVELHMMRFFTAVCLFLS